VSGRTPYLAAFSGISSCAIVGMTTSVRGNTAANWIMLALLHAVLLLLTFGGLESMELRVGIFAVGAGGDSVRAARTEDRRPHQRRRSGRGVRDRREVRTGRRCGRRDRRHRDRASSR
jgi:hypothetical protein